MTPAARERLLRDLLSLPTAPFCEGAVINVVQQWAHREGLDFRRDEWGNVWLKAGGKQTPSPWILQAHMDHPGFVVTRQRGRRVWTEFRGSVRKSFFQGSRVRLFTAEGEYPAEVKTHRQSRKAVFPTCRLELDEPAAIPAGTIGMWDVTACRIRGRVVSARACDDVAGVAAVLCAMRILHRDGGTPVRALLTRGEEAAFLGALAVARAGRLPKHARIVGIETSRAQRDAELGDGVVIRVGDRVRTFDPALTAHLSLLADRLAKRNRSFRFCRQLMPGGTCETTAFAAMGVCAAALCLPLGNYHNMSDDGTIAPEQIHLDDFHSAVDLLSAIPREKPDSPSAEELLRQRLDGIWQQRSGYLKDSRR